MRFSLIIGFVVAFFIHWIGLSQSLLSRQIIKMEKLPQKIISISLTKQPAKNVEKSEPNAISPAISETIAPIEKKISPKKPNLKKKVKPKKKLPDPQKAQKKILNPLIENREENNDVLTKHTVKEKIASSQPEQLMEQPSEQKIEQPVISKTVKNVKNACTKQSYCPQPDYPFVAKQRYIEGWVKLALTIDGKGAVVNVKILASEPEEIFEESALNAVEQWRDLAEHFYNQIVEQTIYFNLQN
ncbi:MAG: hypothetical protein RIT27_1038 [Pseudomonadota bacterium]|jgi:TonB family protein